MVDVNKILNSEKYMQIADAFLNDGKIDAEELKRLGLGNLTPKEQEELNTALSFRFSSASNSEIDGPEHTDGRQESRVERYLSEQKNEEKSTWDQITDWVKGNISDATGWVHKNKEGIQDVAKNIFRFGTGLGVLSMLTSCEKYNINQNQEAILKFDSMDKILDAFLQNQLTLEQLYKEIQHLNKNVESLGNAVQMVIDLLVENNKYLEQIQTDLEENNTQNTEILNVLKDIKNTVDALNELVNNINVSNSNITTELQNIYNAVVDGNLSLDEMKDQIQSLKDLLTEILNNQDYQITLQKDSNMTLDQIKALLANIDATDMSQLETLIEILNAIKEVGDKVDTLIDQVNSAIDLINKQYENDQEIKNTLNVILQLVQNNQVDASKTNELLNKIIEMLNKFGSSEITKQDIAAIIDAISKNGDKIDATNQLLAKIQAQDENFQKQVLAILADLGVQSSEALTAILEAIVNDSAKLDAIAQLLAKIQATVEKYGEEGKDLGNQILAAINKLGTDISGSLTVILDAINNANGGNSENIEALLEKVLEKMDQMDANQQASAKAILEAIANIKVGEGGSVDLSSIEAMLKELIELTKDTNGVLTDMNTKLDVLNVTAQAILDKINVEANKNDERYVAVNQLMTDILNQLKVAGGYDDTKLMEILADLSAMIDTRLEELLKAIKDHDVNVTIEGGTIKCECTCGNGGNHEGILGDLEEALG